MKTLKISVRQQAQAKRNMVEGWLVQESIVYICEFLGRRDIPMLVLRHGKEDERMTDKVP